MISVILPCYQEPVKYLKESLESILNQSYYDIEVIVIIDGKNEPFEKLLESYVKKDYRIRVYTNEHNRGLPYSLNRGISLSKGEYIARMDADDISFPERIQREFSYLLKNDFDLIGTYCEVINAEGKLIGYKKGPTETKDIYRILTKRNCIWHPTWLFRKRVWSEVGGYADFRNGQDRHFLLKARKLGFRLGVLPDICLKYRLLDNTLARQKMPIYWARGEYFSEHAEEIFSITPESWKAYIESVQGQKRLNDIERFMKIREQFGVSMWSTAWYGLKLISCSYGREKISKRMKELFSF